MYVCLVHAVYLIPLYLLYLKLCCLDFFKNKFYMFFFYFRNLCLFQKARLEEALTVFSAMCLTREPGSSAQTRRGRCTTVRAVWRPTPGSTCTTSGSGTNVGTIYQARSTYLGLPHFLATPPPLPIRDLDRWTRFGLGKMSMNKIPGKILIQLFCNVVFFLWNTMNQCLQVWDSQLGFWIFFSSLVLVRYLK